MDWKQILATIFGGGVGYMGDKQTAQDISDARNRTTGRYDDWKGRLDSITSGNADNPFVTQARTGMIDKLSTPFNLPEYTNPYANNPNFGQPDADVNSAYKQAVMRGSMLSPTGTEARDMALQNLRNRTAVRPRIGG